jgi:hypothetical protein
MAEDVWRPPVLSFRISAEILDTQRDCAEFFARLTTPERRENELRVCADRFLLAEADKNFR